MPTSTIALMGRIPSLMGRFLTLVGRFPDFVLRSRCTPLENPLENSPLRKSGKEKAHKHEEIFPVTARGRGGSPDRVARGPDRWPGVKSLCAVCGTQGT